MPPSNFIYSAYGAVVFAIGMVVAGGYPARLLIGAAVYATIVLIGGAIYSGLKKRQEDRERARRMSL